MIEEDTLLKEQEQIRSGILRLSNFNTFAFPASTLRKGGGANRIAVLEDKQFPISIAVRVPLYKKGIGGGTVETWEYDQRVFLNSVRMAQLQERDERLKVAFPQVFAVGSASESDKTVIDYSQSPLREVREPYIYISPYRMPSQFDSRTFGRGYYDQKLRPCTIVEGLRPEDGWEFGLPYLDGLIAAGEEPKIRQGIMDRLTVFCVATWGMDALLKQGYWIPDFKGAYGFRRGDDGRIVEARCLDFDNLLEAKDPGNAVTVIFRNLYGSGVDVPIPGEDLAYPSNKAYDLWRSFIVKCRAKGEGDEEAEVSDLLELRSEAIDIREEFESTL